MANVRVEVRYKGDDPKEQEASFRRSFSIFKRRVNDAGVLTEFNMRQAYESKSEKTRRKRKESETRRLREGSLQRRCRDFFGQ